MKQIRTKLSALAMMALLACAMFALVACSDSDTDAEDTPEDVITTAVVYYSATGTTQTIADMIAGPTNAMLFDITPTVAYSEADLDYDNPESRVNLEHDADAPNGELVMTTMPGWDTYDVVFIGYPIWWGEAAFPVQSFVQANNFSGKRVIPFCTSASSGIGNSVDALAGLTRTGNWLPDGGSFNAFTTQEEVDAWLASLDLDGTAGTEAEADNGPLS